LRRQRNDDRRYEQKSRANTSHIASCAAIVFRSSLRLRRARIDSYITILLRLSTHTIRISDWVRDVFAEPAAQAFWCTVMFSRQENRTKRPYYGAETQSDLFGMSLLIPFSDGCCRSCAGRFPGCLDFANSPLAAVPQTTTVRNPW